MLSRTIWRCVGHWGSSCAGLERGYWILSPSWNDTELPISLLSWPCSGPCSRPTVSPLPGHSGSPSCGVSLDIGALPTHALRFHRGGCFLITLAVPGHTSTARKRSNGCWKPPDVYHPSTV